MLQLTDVLAVAYVLVFTVATGLQRVLWVYVTGQPQLLLRPVPEALRRHNNLVLALTPLGFGVLIPVSVLVPQIALIVWLVVIAAVVVVRTLSHRRSGAHGHRERESAR